LSELLDDLRDEIAKGHVLAIVGAGVSMGATDGDPVASWTGLLKNGVERCVEVAQPLPARWAERVREEIESGDLDDLLSAAEKVSAKLGAPAGGEYPRWLRETVGGLRVKEGSVIEALGDLGIPLATTNYDGLLEEVTGRPPVSWRQGAKVERVFREDGPGILHLHGYWEEPELVVLGIRSYEQVLGDAQAQNLQRVLRTARTLLFVGCGAGLRDPNFGAFLRWTRAVFPGSEYRHFRLCRDSEVASVQQEHPPAERIFALGYGAGHGDLAPFLQSLKATGQIQTANLPAAAQPGPAPRLPGLPRCFGRDDEVRTLIDSLCADPPPPVPILGPAGAGKTTVTLAALHDRRVVDRFGKRRYFVRCDSAKNRDSLVGEIARWMQIETGPQLEAQLFAELERGPAVLALDNAETPWWADTTATEELLAQLCGIPGLALVASIRGEQRPLGPAWREAIRVGPLDRTAARAAFLAVAGQRFENDPDLDRLLEAVDRLALAVTLLAHQAEGEPDLAGLWQRWQEKRTEMLQRAGGKERLTNVEVSLELSIGSPRMTEGARRLLALLGVLPDGIAREDLAALLPDAEEAAAVLRQVGLALPHDPRLRVLAPVREYVHSRHAPAEDDRKQAMSHYVNLAQTAELVGYEGGAEVVSRLSPEIGDVEAMILLGLGSSDPKPAIQAAQSLGKFIRFTGLGLPTILEAALEAARTIGDVQLEASCLESLGDIALYRSDHDEARIKLEEALSFYKRVGDRFGEANCIQSLGNIALRLSNYHDARASLEEALPLYQRVGNLRGEANCIQGLGNIALRLSNYNDARARFEEALPLYSGVGDLLGEANCIRGLGHLDLRCSNHEGARARFKEALLLYSRVGALLGEANCIQGLGEIALRRSQQADAQAKFEEALRIYERIHEPYAIGWMHVLLARLSTEEARRAHVEAARVAWESIQRPDLVEGLRWEFSDLFPEPASPEPAFPSP
jgi:tetratricopeptide (TPR) repeat protein